MRQTDQSRNYRKDSIALKLFVAFVTCVVSLKFQLLQVAMFSLELWILYKQFSALMRFTGETAVHTLSYMCSL
jgi:hypothetical protein